ncbi:MAG: hypothetical protein NUV91_10015 [Candidatus Omnitrophica bacterium]|nr:hypothetical protein [Candidatus Omnitrophota bacterium]
MKNIFFKMVGVVFSLALLSLFSFSSAEDLNFSYKINGQPVKAGDQLKIFGADLKTSRLEFEVTVPAEIQSLEISLNGGRTWDGMKAKGNVFTYKFRPDEVQELNPTFLVEQEDGTTKIENPQIIVLYQEVRPEDAILQLFDRMKTSYENEQKTQFMNNISSSFPNRVELEEAIQTDFNTFQNIRLRYQVQSAVISPNQVNAIYQVLWEKKWQNNSGVNDSSSATIGMNVGRESGDWKVKNMRDNSIFGATLVEQSKPELTGSDMTVNSTGQTITITINNTESRVAENIQVDFYMQNATFFPTTTFVGTQTITSLAGNSSTTLTQTGVTMSGVDCNTGTVVIDPLNRIDEVNETNNQIIDTDGTCP